MKPLLLLTFCLFTICVFAQSMQLNDETSKNFPVLQKRTGSQVNKDTVPNKSSYNFRTQEFDVTFTPNRKIISLPQGNMPCVVPDTGGIAQIPNAWPNAAIPFRLPGGAIPNPGIQQGLTEKK
jgi:hypothetical protein